MAPAPAPDRPAAGHSVKTLFTILAAGRYGFGMVIFASLALATAGLAVPLERVEPQARQARATVTILPAARLHFSDIEREHPELLRESAARGADGSVEALRLVEFQ